jgi:hypothetical protein
MPILWRERFSRISDREEVKLKIQSEKGLKVVVQNRPSNKLPLEEPPKSEADARAERRAAIKAKQLEDAPRAMQEYRIAESDVRRKTRKLRAERLAREVLKA